MKTLWLSTLILFSGVTFADEFKAKPASAQSSCDKKVETLVRKTAIDMGAPRKIGLHFESRSAGSDLRGRPLTEFKSGVFITEDGYLSGSMANVTVRDSGGDCTIVHVEVSVGN